jgi:DNA-binding NarL/FixJ family response regulator
MTLRVLVVDDHSLFRDGIASMLRAAGMVVVGEARDGQSAISEARRLKPDLILMDIDMPGMNGIEATRAITKEMPGINVVMLTVSQEDTHLIEALRAGAKGYLLKSLGSDEFLKLLGNLEKDLPPIPDVMTARLVAHVAHSSERVEARDDHLSGRETEILALLGLGLTNKQIAERVGVSENTVKYHVKNILQDLQMNSRAEAAAYAVRHGVTPPE